MSQVGRNNAGKADALFHKAFAAHNAGQFKDAEGLYRKALRKTPADMETLYLLGTVCAQLGKADDAVKYLTNALKIAPDHLPALNSMGLTLRGVRKLDESAATFRRVLELKPDYVDALSNLGSLLELQGKLDEAEVNLRKALALNPDLANVHYNLGLVLSGKDRFEEAARHFVRGLELDSNIPTAYGDLGGIYKRWGRLDQALECFDRALIGLPKAHYLHTNRGATLEELGRFEEAMQEYETATELCPEDPIAKWNTAFLYLRQGVLDPGWQLHELRLKHGGQVSERFPFPRWDGSDISDKTVLVYAEQGLGDEIWFASCIPDLIARSKHCVIECAPRLATLFGRSFPTATIVGGQRMQIGWLVDVPGIDVQVAIGTMPLYLRPTLESFPTAPQYLYADPQRIEYWRSRMAVLGSGLKVGICWRSGLVVGERHKNYSELTQWGGILSLPGVQFVNLQYDECTEELRAAEEKFGIQIARFPELDLKNALDDTTALMSAMDLVISAGTAVSELAGAAGVDTYRLDPFGKPMDALGTGRSPWHPRMKLFGQTAVGDWDTPLALMAVALAEKVAGEATAIEYVPLASGVEIAVKGSLDDLSTYVLKEQSGWHDPEYSFVLGLATAGMRIVDVGAGVGAYAIPMAAKVADGRVWALAHTAADANFLMKSRMRNRLEKCLNVSMADHELSLDAEMDRHGLDGIAFLRVAGALVTPELFERGNAFLSANSPLLMFEMRPDKDFNHAAAEWLAMHDFGLYRLVPGLDLLVPLVSLEETDAYTLNLFACRADRADVLQQQGVLMRQPQALERLPGIDLRYWQAYLRTLPYAANGVDAWTNAQNKEKDWEVYWMALNLFAMAKSGQGGAASQPALRYACLQTADAIMLTLVQEQATLPRLLSLCRMHADLGKREAAVSLLNRICDLINSGMPASVHEAFLVLGDAFDRRAVDARNGDWIIPMILEQRENLRAFSTFFTNQEALPVLQEIQASGFGSEELERRIVLIKMRFGMN